MTNQKSDGGPASINQLGEQATSVTIHTKNTDQLKLTVAEKRNLVTIEEAAEEARVSAKTLRKWVRSGRIKVVPNLRPYLVSRSSLQALLEGQYL